MKLPPTSPHLSLSNRLSQTSKADSNSLVSQQGSSLASTFEEMLQDVNQQQLAAEAKKVEFLTSPQKDIHGTIIALEKADVSLKLLMQVRNKVVSAYEEIIRMQV